MTTHKQKLRVLLVGLNKHHPDSKKIKNLKGCVNDINAFESLIQNYFKHLNPEIKKLRDEDATREKIVQTFREHLIQHADEHTTTLFYFSGHGSKQLTDPVFLKYSADYDREETLICYDSRIPKGLDLADKELAILIKELDQKKAHCVIILDCCHSGSGTRSLSGASPEGIREAEPRLEQPGRMKYPYLENYYKKMLQDTGLVQVPKGKHILMAACQKEQTAREIKFEGQTRGIFSYTLEQVISKYKGKINYADVFSECYTEMMKHSFQQGDKPQHPSFEPLEGFSANALFLDATIQRTDGYDVIFDQGAWQLTSGAVQGFTLEAHQSILLDIYTLDEPSRCVAQARIAAIRMLYSTLEIISGNLDQHQKYLAEIISLPLPKIPVALEGNRDLISRLLPELAKDTHAIFGTSPAAHRFMLEENAYVFYHQGEERYRYNVAPKASAIRLDIAHIAGWELRLNNNNPISQIPHHQIIFELDTKDGKNITKLSDQSNSVNQYYALTSSQNNYYQGKEEAWYVPGNFYVQNTSKLDLYVMLLYFSPDYGIQVIQKTTAKAKSDKFILAEEITFHTGNSSSSVDHFRLFISTVEAQTYSFAQDALGDRNSKDRDQATAEAALAEDWYFKTITTKTTQIQG